MIFDLPYYSLAFSRCLAYNVCHIDLKMLIIVVNGLLCVNYRERSPIDILQALRDENMNDPRDRIEIAQSHAFYMPSLLGKPIDS